jgi:hypothetical protein
MMHILFIALRDTHNRNSNDHAPLSDVNNSRQQLDYGICIEILSIALLSEVPLVYTTFVVIRNAVRKLRLTL